MSDGDALRHGPAEPHPSPPRKQAGGSRRSPLLGSHPFKSDPRTALLGGVNLGGNSRCPWRATGEPSGSCSTNTVHGSLLMHDHHGRASSADRVVLSDAAGECCDLEPGRPELDPVCGRARSQVAWPSEAIWPVAHNLLAHEPVGQGRGARSRIHGAPGGRDHSDQDEALVVDSPIIKAHPKGDILLTEPPPTSCGLTLRGS